MISKTLGTSSRRFARLRADQPGVGLFAQALYPLLVANADDWGRQKGDGFTVKHGVWSTAPEDDATFDRALDAMAAVGLVTRYQVGSETYAQIVDFDAHQRGLHKRTASLCPAPPAVECGTSGKSAELPQSSPLIELNLTEQNRTEGARALIAEDDPEVVRERFERFWAKYPRREQMEPARMIWRDMAPSETVTGEILASLEAHRCSAPWVEAIGARELRYIPLAKTFLRDRLWLDHPPPASASHGATRCPHSTRCLDDVACTARSNADREAQWRAPADGVIQ